MSQGEIMDRVEVELPADILKDLVEPGKIFEKDVFTGGEDVEKSKRPRICLRFEKMADSLVKIFITTFKPKEDDLSNTSMQTEKIDTDTSSMQTDTKKTETLQSQTDQCNMEESAMQTEKKQEKTQQQQTEVKCDNHKEQQTEIKEEKHQHQQTTVREYRDSPSQTKHKIFTSTECQTVAKAIVEQDSQTDIAEVKSHLAQTDMSMANLIDGCTQHEIEMSSVESQAAVITDEREIQATVLSVDSVVQTVIDTKTTEVQAVVDIGEVVLQTDLSMLNYTEMSCQAGVDVAAQDCQTDSSMAYQEEIAIQAVVSNSDISQQTEKLVQEVQCIQTDYLGESIETQTIPDVNNQEVQTDNVTIIDNMPNIQDGTGMEQMPGQDNAEPPAICDEPPNITGEENVHPGEVIDPIAVTPMAGEGQPQSNISETSSQTDPVTIIIGDASFLVQKLKSASINPAKVTGNEIEIEINEGGSDNITQNGDPPEIYTAPVPVASPKTPQQWQATPKMKSQSNKALPVTVTTPSFSDIPVKKGRPRKLTPKAAALAMDQKQHVVGVKQAYVPKPIAVVDASYSCPFCDMTFVESPQLYEHITSTHNDALVKGHKKPKGREGKTIIPRSVGVQQVGGSPPYLVPQSMVTSVQSSPNQYGRVVHEQVVGQHQVEVIAAHDSSEVEPPVLEPIYGIPKQSSVIKSPSAAAVITGKKTNKTYTRQVQQPEPSLFEDLPQPTRSYPRNRVKREDNREPDEEGEEEEDGPSGAMQPQIDAYEYECPHCPEKYGSASHLYTHLKRSHRSDLDKNKTSAGAQEGESVQPTDDTATPASTPGRKRKRISATPSVAATVATSVEPTKKQKMSTEEDELQEEELQEGVPASEEVEQAEELAEDEEIPADEELQAANEIAQENTGSVENVDEVAEEATEELPEIKSPKRKYSSEQSQEGSSAVLLTETPLVKRSRGRPPKSVKKGSPAVTNENSPRVSGRGKRT